MDSAVGQHGSSRGSAPGPSLGSRQPWRAALLVGLATLLLVLALFLAWQSWLVLAQHAGERAAGRVRSELVQDLTDEIARIRAQLEAALASTPVQQALASDDAGSRAAAAVALRQVLPGVEQADFYDAGINEVLVGNLAHFGYSRAALLMRAKLGGMPIAAELRGESDKAAHLLFALPVRHDDAITAYAMLVLPFAPVLEKFRSVELHGGRLDLRQGDGHGDLLIASVGDGNGNSMSDAGIPIAGSGLRIGTAVPEAFVVVSRNPAVPLALSVLCLLGGVAALWLRGGAPRWRRLPVLGDELTLGESVKDKTPGKPARRAPAAARAVPAPVVRDAPVEVARSMFRSYDIRGVVGEGLTPAVARVLGRAIGAEAKERGLGAIVVGRDGRLSGPDLAAALIEGLRASGLDVTDIGLAPTPLVYYAAQQLAAGSGVAVTGSHNPPDYNGFKIVLGGETLAEDAIQALYERIHARRFVDGKGTLRYTDVAAEYTARIADDIQLARRLKVVVDCGNGVAGAIAPRLLEEIGCEVLPLYCEVDGHFPNHHPDPSVPDNLKDLILTVDRTGADLGLAFDGDGDRLGVVTRTGELIFPDRLLMLFAIDVLGRSPGATIIYDVKCTGHLGAVILAHGGSPLMWKTGHSLIKAKMRETGAALAGEMSGHFFFRERWYGFDDGIYSAARLLEILAADAAGRSAEEIFATLPRGVSTPELKIPLAEGEHYRFIERFRQRAVFDGARLTTLDGLRADWPDGFGLVRASNTTPVLVLRFDADNAAALERIEDAFRVQLRQVDPDLALPF
jgi:phosphomannomutase/phosphoglucomutase